MMSVIEEKIATIQASMAKWIRRWPQQFNQNMFAEMHSFFFLCGDLFKDKRSTRYLTQLIVALSLIRHRLRKAVRAEPEKRHLYVKLFKNRRTLGVLVAVNFLQEKELFEKRHLLRAIQHYIPVQAVEGAFFSHRQGDEEISTLYMEVEKIDGQPFYLQETLLLQRELSLDLKNRIEQRIHPIFMPRNEEEVMRYVLSLSNEIKYVRDMPQAVISFDEQSDSSLFFTVILVRVVKPKMPSVEWQFFAARSFLTYLHEKTKVIGSLRNKYPKEATIFRVKIPKKKFLRWDHSIHLYKARQAVFDEINRIVGEVRDFNGGMMTAQSELLDLLKESVGSERTSTEVWLENFYYSLSPVIRRTTLKADVLKTLFLMQNEMREERFFPEEGYAVQMKADGEFVYVMIKAKNSTIKEELSKLFNKLKLTPSDLTHSYVEMDETPYIGYLYHCEDPQKQGEFCQVVNNIIQSWDTRKLA